MRNRRETNVATVNFAVYVQLAYSFTCCSLLAVLFLSVPARCAALPAARNAFHPTSPLREDFVENWAVAAAASATAAMESAAAAAVAAHNAIAPPGPPLLSPDKWRKRRSDGEGKYSEEDRPPGLGALNSNEASRFTPYVSVGVLSNLQSFFDVLRENLDSLEAMSPEDREALLREFKAAEEVGGITAPLRQAPLRAPHPPNATAQRPASTAAHIHAQRSGRPSSKTRQFVTNTDSAFNLHDPGLHWVGLGKR